MSAGQDLESQQIAQQAARWFAINREGSLSPAQREQFSQWLAQSPAHMHEYLSINESWCPEESADAWPEDIEPSFDEEMQAEDDLMAMSDRPPGAPMEPRPRRWPLVVAVAASAALMPAMLVLVSSRHPQADALTVPRMVSDPNSANGELDAVRHWEMLRKVSAENGEEMP